MYMHLQYRYLAKKLRDILKAADEKNRIRNRIRIRVKMSRRSGKLNTKQHEKKMKMTCGLAWPALT
jgi:hypothetical protein